MKNNWLILTDHVGHSDQNSVYALARTLARDGRTGAVHIASRGDERNAAFFAGDLNAPLYTLPVGEDFAFGVDWTAADAALAGSLTGKLPGQPTVWLRLPPPADEKFFAALDDSELTVLNRPAGILATGDKSFLINFPDWTTDIELLYSAADIEAFARRFPVVLKPLRDYGGRGILKIEWGTVYDGDRAVSLDNWISGVGAATATPLYLGMRYLKNVYQGDKRILVVNGEILGASVRLPAPGGWLCNVARGGSSRPAEVDDHERQMVAAITPALLERGVVIYGMDTLVADDGRRVLSELNTNSIGGFPQSEAQSGRPVLQQTIDGLYAYLDRSY